MITIYVFDCPVHGEEQNILCWRAFQEDNKHLWKKYEVQQTQVDFPEAELAIMFEQLKQEDEEARVKNQMVYR